MLSRRLGFSTGLLALTALTMTAPAQAQLGMGQVINGELSNSDSTRANGAYCDTYIFPGQGGQQVTIRLDSPTLDTFLILQDPQGNEVAFDDDSGGNLNAMIATTLPGSGNYTVLATTYMSGSTGSYSLSAMQGLMESNNEFDMMGGGDYNTWLPMQGTGIPTGSGRQISMSQTVNDQLQRGDNTLETGEFQDTYSFRGEQGQGVRVAVESSQFDTYLILRSPSRSQMENDDMTLDNTNSAISATLPESGNYDIIVTSYDVGESGSYSLTLLPPLANNMISPISADQSVQGVLTNGDSVEAGVYYDTWPVNVMAGQRLTIEVNSDSFDTVLTATEPNGMSQQNDDWEGTNSRVDLAPQYTGTVNVRVAAYGAGESGSYNLVLRQNASDWGAQPPEPDFGGFGGMFSDTRDVSQIQPTGTISVGQSLPGTLNASDQRVDESFADAYSFQGQAGQPVTIRMIGNGDLDPYLILRNPDGTQTDNDDSDAVGGFNSQIMMALPQTGTYTIIATTFMEESGSYTLTLN